jgi:hypothetical protein
VSKRCHFDVFIHYQNSVKTMLFLCNLYIKCFDAEMTSFWHFCFMICLMEFWYSFDIVLIRVRVRVRVKKFRFFSGYLMEVWHSFDTSCLIRFDTVLTFSWYCFPSKWHLNYIVLTSIWHCNFTSDNSRIKNHLNYIKGSLKFCNIKQYYYGFKLFIKSETASTESVEAEKFTTESII